jgi:hypothetical protein
MSDTRDPEVTDFETIQRRSAFQALEPVKRPSYWGVDRDPARRPGFPMMRREPGPLANTKWPPERQQGEPASPMHGRSNKPLPPVFGTALPLRGLSGMIKRRAYALPDHYPSHWLLKIFGDRVDSWEHRVKKLLPVLVPLAAAAVLLRAAPARRRGLLARLGWR